MTNSMVAVNGHRTKTSAHKGDRLSGEKGVAMSELWAPNQIKDALGVGHRDTVARWQQRDDFPEPKMVHGATRFYDSAEVLAWHASFKGNPKKQQVLAIFRADPTRSMKSIGKEVPCSPASAKAWLIQMGELPAPAKDALNDGEPNGN